MYVLYVLYMRAQHKSLPLIEKQKTEATATITKVLLIAAGQLILR